MEPQAAGLAPAAGQGLCSAKVPGSCLAAARHTQISVFQLVTPVLLEWGLLLLLCAPGSLALTLAGTLWFRKVRRGR